MSRALRRNNDDPEDEHEGEVRLREGYGRVRMQTAGHGSNSRSGHQRGKEEAKGYRMMPRESTDDDSEVVSVRRLGISKDRIRMMKDPFHCYVPIPQSTIHKSDRKLEDHRIPRGESGFALVDISCRIAAGGRPFWENKSTHFHDESAIKADYLAAFAEVKGVQEQLIHSHKKPNSGRSQYINWSAWKPPTLHVAFLLRTGQSCPVNN
ncbi:hypothetical protein NHQ30_011036 [Ciborinia camelliae]|nr:hypothetical protein NHQ30_011036 [Ciborinia camelliae]